MAAEHMGASAPVQQPGGGSVPAVTSPAVPASPAQWTPPVMTEAEFNQMRELAAMGLSARQAEAVRAEVERVRGAQAAPAPSVQAAHPVTGITPWDSANEFWLTEENGRVVAKPGAPADVLPAYERHQATKRAWFNKLAVDPAGALQPLLQAEIDRRVQEQLAASGQQTAHQQQVQRIEADFVQWGVEKDPQGQPRRDWQGNPQFTEAGSIYMGVLGQLRNFNLPPQMVDQLAQAQVRAVMLERKLTSPQAAPQPTQPALPTTFQSQPGQQPSMQAVLDLNAAGKASLLQTAQSRAAANPQVPGVNPATTPAPNPFQRNAQPSFFGQAMLKGQQMGLIAPNTNNRL